MNGCREQADSFDMSRNAASWNSSKISARQELSEIPAPVKQTYVTIDKESKWQNPFLTVESNMIQLRIYLADENSSEVDRGGMTRLSTARKHTLNVRLKDLPRAMSSLPDGAWPYGRVVAVNEALEAPQNQARLNRNLATTIQTLREMGIVVENWTNRNPG